MRYPGLSPVPVPCPIGDAFGRLGLPCQMLFSTDQSQGVAFIQMHDGRLGLLRWSEPGLHADLRELQRRIVWGRAGALLPLAEEAERNLGFHNAEGIPLLSEQLRALYRGLS